MLKSPISARNEETRSRELLLSLNRRLASAAIAGGIAAASMALAIVVMLPLKEVRPYVIEVNKADGSAYVPPQAEAVAYDPQFETIAFFLRRWLSDAFTINQYSTVQTLDPRARQFLRGANVIGAYKDFVARDGKFERLARDPTLVRDVEVTSLTQIAGTKNGVVAEVKLLTRTGGVAKEERRLVTIYYEIFPPKERVEVERNPIGIYVTDFKVSDA